MANDHIIKLELSETTKELFSAMGVELGKIARELQTQKKDSIAKKIIFGSREDIIRQETADALAAQKKLLALVGGHDDSGTYVYPTGLTNTPENLQFLKMLQEALNFDFTNAPTVWNTPMRDASRGMQPPEVKEAFQKMVDAAGSGNFATTEMSTVSQAFKNWRLPEAVARQDLDSALKKAGIDLSNVSITKDTTVTVAM